MRERILEHNRDVRFLQTDNSAIVKHTHDEDHLTNWSGVQCIAHDRYWNTRRVKEAFQIRLHTNTINRGINIPESWMSIIHRHMQQTKTSTVSVTPTTEQHANRPPITEQHQRDQPGTINFNPTYHRVSLQTESTLSLRSLRPTTKFASK